MDIITVRPYEVSESDVEDFIAWVDNPEVQIKSRLSWMVGLGASRARVEKFFKQVVIPHPWYRAICVDGHPIGFISIEPAGSGSSSSHKARAQVSYAFGRDYWGRGITTAALKMAVAAAFQELPQLLRIEALVVPSNIASQRVLLKAGFVKEGLLRNYLVIRDEATDAFIYSILSTHHPMAMPL